LFVLTKGKKLSNRSETWEYAACKALADEEASAFVSIPGTIPVTSIRGSKGNASGLKVTNPFFGSEMYSRSLSIWNEEKPNLSG
jgi:hypothetical protein